MRPLLGLILGLCLSLSLVSLAGENPIHVLEILMKSSFGSVYDLGLTLFYTTSFIFTGLSVCIAFHAGLFNIGAEGQLTIATLMAAWTGIYLNQIQPGMSPVLAIPLIILVASLSGALWGFVPGWLKSKRGSHEVIVTMMMNFIAAAFSSYIALNLIRSTESQNPETQSIPETMMFKNFDFIQKFFQDSPANLSLIVALALAGLLYLYLYKTIPGFELRASGKNETASNLSGINAQKIKIFAMTAAGMMSAMVALNEVLGSSGKFRIGFSADYGFVGIAVAILAKNNPLGIVFSALLFGVLQKGASDLDVETEFITRDFARIIQATLIFSVAAIYFLPKNYRFKTFLKVVGSKFKISQGDS